VENQLISDATTRCNCFY